MKKYTIYRNDTKISVCTYSMEEAISRFKEIGIDCTHFKIIISEYRK